MLNHVGSCAAQMLYTCMHTCQNDVWENMRTEFEITPLNYGTEFISYKYHLNAQSRLPNVYVFM